MGTCCAPGATNEPPPVTPFKKPDMPTNEKVELPPDPPTVEKPAEPKKSDNAEKIK